MMVPNCSDTCGDRVMNAITDIADATISRPHAPAPRPLSRPKIAGRSVEHTSELQSLMRTSYAVFRLNNSHKIANHNAAPFDTQNQYDTVTANINDPTIGNAHI